MDKQNFHSACTSVCSHHFITAVKRACAWLKTAELSFHPIFRLKEAIRLHNALIFSQMLFFQNRIKIKNTIVCIASFRVEKHLSKRITTFTNKKGDLLTSRLLYAD